MDWQFTLSDEYMDTLTLEQQIELQVYLALCYVAVETERRKEAEQNRAAWQEIADLFD